jgi:type II secretory ATPase GspE/PulE/Tfp pilus assembly ATPase PilB-like protein
MTFDNILKYVLRQDPDVILVGEIRDEETLRIAIQASLTGHLVLSTIHANDAISTIVRMKEMNVNIEYLFSSLIGVVNQRLIRKLCNNCKKTKNIDPTEIKRLLMRENEDEDLIDKEEIETITTIFEPNGCPLCNWTGYLGMTSIAELVIFDNYLKELMNQNIPSYKIKSILKKEKKQKYTINDAINKLKMGITSVNEISRII